MLTRKNRRESNSLLTIFGATAFALSLMAVPAVAAPVATQAVISAQRVGHQPDELYATVTHLTVPPQAAWATDPDAGPLTLRVEKGVLGVMLGGGSARIERQSSPLMDEQLVDEQVTPLPPGQMAVLRPGDRLVIVRGFQLAITNDKDEPATAIMSRLQHASDLTMERESRLVAS